MNIPQALPRIAQFEKMGFGMFIHWGLYSQLEQGEWAQAYQKIPFAEYRKLADNFTASEFDAEAIARLAKEAGMKYVVLTTRHHEGFSLYDTKGLSDFDVMHSPTGRDLVRGGVVTDPAVRERVVAEISAFGTETLGLSLLGTAESPIRGKDKGNVEYLAWWRKGDELK